MIHNGPHGLLIHEEVCEPVEEISLALLPLAREEHQKHRAHLGSPLVPYHRLVQQPDAYERAVAHRLYGVRHGDQVPVRGGCRRLAPGDLLAEVGVDLALLGNGMLKGKALADFIARSEKLLGK